MHSHVQMMHNDQHRRIVTMGPLVLAFGVLTLLVTTLTCVEGQAAPGCNVTSCKPPECYCVSSRIPMDFSAENVPQMVIFSFGGPLDITKGDLIKDLFNKKRRNPNGSPIRSTLFVSDDNGGTDYCTVNNLWAQGHEIASFSVSRRDPAYWWVTANQNAWAKEIDTQKEYLVGNASIPAEHITGFRNPHLQTGGNTQYRFAVSSNWTYDSTIVLPLKYNEATQPKVWPYTMDAPASFQCDYTCPDASFPGLWQVPFQTLTDVYGQPCRYLDSCINTPEDGDDVFNILMQSFNRSYNNNRAPMMVNFKNYKSFFESNTPWALDGVHKFIDEVLAYAADDVWFVTYQDMIEWMQAPMELKTIKFFPAFMRDLEDYKKMACIEKRTVEAFFNGVNVLIVEIIACVVAFIILYFKDN